MLKKACFLIVFTSMLFLNLSFSQEQSASINGKVTETKSSKGIEADIKLFKLNDSTLFMGTKSDTAGIFKFENIQFGSYRIEIYALEYTPAIVDTFKAGQISETLNIQLKKQDITTEEIDVEDTKGLIEFSADKKIFNVDQSIVTKGGTAIDVLKKTPLLEVDINDNVTMRGSKNVMITINDKPSKMSLKQIPAEMVEKIELITNPPARYEAEGVTGIINIVTKKIDLMGYNGGVYIGLATKDRYWSGLDLNMKKNKWTVYGGLNAGLYNFGFENNYRTDYFNPVYSITGSGSGSGNNKYGNAYTTLEYDPVKGHTIGIEGSINYGIWKNDNFAANDNFSNSGVYTSGYDRSNFYKGIWRGYSASMYYTGKLSEQGRELTGNITYSGNNNNTYMNLDVTNYDSAGAVTGNIFRQHDDTKFNSYNINGQADYTHPLTLNSKIEGGLKSIYRVNNNDFDSDTFDYNQNGFVHNISVTNHFKLTEIISSAYVSYSNTFGGFGFRLGLRAERTDVKGEQLINSSGFKKNYYSVFPSISLTQKIGTANQLQASFSRRITRPNIWRLNPFINKYDPKYWYAGNPELNPEFTNSFELSFMLFTKIITVTPMAFYRQSYDVITNYSSLVDSSVQFTTYRNAAGSKAYGMDLLLSSRTLQWLNLNGTVSIYKTKFDSDAIISDYAEEAGVSWKANIRAYLTLGKLFNFELYYNYTGRRYNAQGYNKPTSTLDMAISKNLLKDKLSISLRASDVFRGQNWGSETRTDEYYTTYSSNYDSRVLFLNISWRFGNTDEYFQKQKKVKQNINESNDSQQDSPTR